MLTTLMRYGVKVSHIEIDKIAPSPHQPRRTFDMESLCGLAESIRNFGIIQPVTVRKVAGGFELVAGERRLRAARIAGLAKVPAIVQEMKEEAQDRDTPSKRSRPTNAEMEARRKEAADAWLATGNPLEDVEKLVNAYARNWTTAQCEKAKQLAAEAMRNGAQQDAPEVSEQPEAQPAPAANMITCPKTETQVSDWTCSDCEQRAGCPAWAE